MLGKMTDSKIKTLSTFLESKGLKKEAYMASLLPLLNMFGCGNDYDLREVAENNMENMFHPECIGSIYMPYNLEDFESNGEVGIPLDEFVSSYSSYNNVKIEYHSNSYAKVGYRDADELGINGYVAIIFKNIPLYHPSWESLGLSELRDSYSNMWKDNQTGERLYIRDVCFYYPKLKIMDKDVVLACTAHVRCYVESEFCTDTWAQDWFRAYDCIPGIFGTREEDAACREAVRRFFEEGPRDAEENL